MMKTMHLQRNNCITFGITQGVLMVLSFLIVLGFTTGAGAVTIIIEGQNSCEAIGTWDPQTATCTLTEDIVSSSEVAIEITGTGITLDGAGKTLSFSGPFPDKGILISGATTGVTVTNITVKGFYYGIYLKDAAGNKITGNDLNGNLLAQIYLESASGNEVSYNAVENSEVYSIAGIWVVDSTKNKFFNNTISYNYYGLYIEGSDANPDDANEIYNNNFISNATQAEVSGVIDYEFSKPLPTGGNYWDDLAGCEDTEPPYGICDAPYIFRDGLGRDTYPWTVENGWEIQESTVTLDIKPGSCDNPVNVKRKGVLPVVILGTKDFQVETIDVGSIKLEGVEPIRSAIFDVLTHGETGDCNELGGDGYPDLVLKFKTKDIVAAIEEAIEPEAVNDGDEVTLTLKGNYIFDNQPTPFTGEDTILIKDKGKHHVKGLKKHIKKLKFKKHHKSKAEHKHNQSKDEHKKK